MNKRVLMIAFHYPPCGASSGLQRTLAFTRYLDRQGWSPALVTVAPGAYPSTSDALVDAIPAGMPLSRPWTIDIARHLSLAGRYPAFLAVPDRWRFWRYSGLRAALRLVREFKPDLLWSTYPIATAHAIGASLASRTGLPWVADMRDPMVEYDDLSKTWFPTDPAVREARLKIEAEVAARASGVVFCTDGARRIFRERYAGRTAASLSVVANGYDESAFARAESEARAAGETRREGFHAVHSGTVYPGTDRGPDALFTAIRELADCDRLPAGFLLTLRASGHDDYLRTLIDRFRVQDLVELAPALPYHQALVEMLHADALVVLQGHTSNPAIPAKVYEYLRARRPILALVHPDGDTARLLSDKEIAACAPLDDAQSIETALGLLLSRHADGVLPATPESTLRTYCREDQTAQLATVLDQVLSGAGAQAVQD